MWFSVTRRLNGHVDQATDCALWLHEFRAGYHWVCAVVGCGLSSLGVLSFDDDIITRHMPSLDI